MLKCKEVSGLVSTDEVAELGFMKKLEFKMHIMMCGHCRRYVQQIKSLGIGARNWATGCEADPQQLKRMEDHVLEEVKGKE